jgi:hypothetical protein
LARLAAAHTRPALLAAISADVGGLLLTALIALNALPLGVSLLASLIGFAAFHYPARVFFGDFFILALQPFLLLLGPLAAHGTALLLGHLKPPFGWATKGNARTFHCGCSNGSIGDRRGANS